LRWSCKRIAGEFEMGRAVTVTAAASRAETKGENLVRIPTPMGDSRIPRRQSKFDIFRSSFMDAAAVSRQAHERSIHGRRAGKPEPHGVELRDEAVICRYIQNQEEEDKRVDQRQRWQ
jgi:hypothetical protein